ncbi:hypothetical protein Nepgr_022737 [Nepenthes gracilis]|uniref:NmrA-like domain-containing protein n=1 Tax=Nepenthes gracilis TaxID=150966 RepID=A0AAD3XYF7_NEPGR|nr:hypothetical protein Nepgr_022737 [Nepenthes gracilis]
MKKTKSYMCRNLNGPIPTTMSTNHGSSFNSTNNNTASNTIYFNCTTLPIAPAGPATLESLTLSSGKYMYSPYQGNIEVRDLEEGEPQNLMFGGHNQEVGLAPESGTMSFCNNDIMVGPNGLDPQGVVLILDEDNGVKQNGKMVNRSEDLESGVTTSSYLDEERFDWEWEGADVADWRDHDHLWSNGDQTDQMLSWMWDSDEIDAEYPNFAGDTDSQKQEALGDLYDHESLLKAIKEVDVVISTVGHALLADQTKIIVAIKEAGANIKKQQLLPM